MSGVTCRQLPTCPNRHGMRVGHNVSYNTRRPEPWFVTKITSSTELAQLRGHYQQGRTAKEKKVTNPQSRFEMAPPLELRTYHEGPALYRFLQSSDLCNRISLRY